MERQASLILQSILVLIGIIICLEIYHFGSILTNSGIQCENNQPKSAASELPNIPHQNTNLKDAVPCPNPSDDNDEAFKLPEPHSFPEKARFDMSDDDDSDNNAHRYRTHPSKHHPEPRHPAPRERLQAHSETTAPMVAAPAQEDPVTADPVKAEPLIPAKIEPPVPEEKPAVPAPAAPAENSGKFNFDSIIGD